MKFKELEKGMCFRYETLPPGCGSMMAHWNFQKVGPTHAQIIGVIKGCPKQALDCVREYRAIGSDDLVTVID